jgi:hypothetical protein
MTNRYTKYAIKYNPGPSKYTFSARDIIVSIILTAIYTHPCVEK